MLNADSALMAEEINILPTDTQSQSNIIEKGKRLFIKYCAHCHGNKGNGDGFNAEYLDKDPTELSSPKFQAKRSNEKLFRVIKEGGAKVKKSHLMPSFGYTLSEEEIWALVTFIRYLGRDKPLVNIPSNVKSGLPMMTVLEKPDVSTFLKWFAKEGQNKTHIDSGKLLVMNKKSCLGCHQLDGEGGRIGPNLSRSAFNYSPEWIYAWISNPQALRSGTKMPNLGLDPKEASSITAFLASFQPDTEDEEIEFNAGPDWQQYFSTQGDPVRGEIIFNDPEGAANCSKCHIIKGKGGSIGPELSFIGTSRTREFILESIINPSKVIASGYETIIILTRERKLITGIKKNEDELGFYLIDKSGKEIHVPIEIVKKFKTQKISTMPGNFKDLLATQDLADILAYLRTLKLPSIN